MTVRRPLVTLPALALVFVLAGCAGVPLKTMLKLSSFGVDDFAELEANEIRAAIQVTDDLAIKPDSTVLKVTLGEADGDPVAHRIPLTTVRSGADVGSGLPKAKRGQQWHLFRLSDEGVRSFEALQEQLRKPVERDGDIRLEVATALDDDASEDALGKTPLEIRLKLADGDGFFTLYRGEIDLEAARRASTE